MNNPGGPVYILNNQSWHQLDLNGIETQIYYEVVNDHLCIKFHADTQDRHKKREIRSALRQVIHSTLGQDLGVVDSGRYGASMTACQIDHDFSDLTSLETSVSIFNQVDRVLPKVVAGLKSIAS